MKTQNNKKSKPARVVLKLAIGAVIGFGIGISLMVKENDNLTTALEETLQQNCDYESITLNHGVTGIRYSNEDGFTNKTVSFTLKNCVYKSSAKEAAARLNDMLKRDVENYDSVDFSTFYFKSEEKDAIVKIRRGTVL